MENYSNTTLVKVKLEQKQRKKQANEIQIQHLLKLNICYFAVAVYIFFIQIQHLLKLNYQIIQTQTKLIYSNTTLVKVKFRDGAWNTVGRGFKYNTC